MFGQAWQFMSKNGVALATGAAAGAVATTAWFKRSELGKLFSKEEPKKRTYKKRAKTAKAGAKA